MRLIQQIKIMNLLLRSVIFFTLLTSSYCSQNNSTKNENSDEDVQELRKKDTGFIITLPQRLIAGKKSPICVTIHQTKIPAKIKIDLKMKDKHYYTDRSLQSVYSCFELSIPDHNKDTPQYVSLKVQVHLNGLLYSSHNYDPLLVYPNKMLTFLETDRLVYKPGDKVKLRILVLTEELLPPKHYKITDVRIRNPYDIAVAVWENVSTDTGLVQLEHQLFKDVIEGKWKIEVNDQIKYFEIKKYILPRFNISIFYPKIIFYGTPYVKFKICSKYSYGKPLKGSAFIRITDSHNNMKPINEMRWMNNGCATFTFSNQQLSLRETKKRFSMIDSKIQLHITATATEYGTDKIVLDTVRSLVNLKEYNMKFVSENIFQPGLPYRGRLQVTDLHTDLWGEIIEICYNVAIKKSWNYLSNEQCSNFTVGANNSIVFNILPLKNNIVHFKLIARSLNHPNIGDSLLVVRLYSPSNNYITVHQNPQKNKVCNNIQEFKIRYTTDNFREQEDITFYYMVKSRDHIYPIKTLTHTVRSNYIYYEELENLVGGTHKYMVQGTPYDEVGLTFTLDPKIVYKYQFLIYYLAKNGETVVATLEVDKDPCFSNKVNAQWSKLQYYPGDKAILNIRTESSSLCSVSSVDIAVEFMNGLKSMNSHSVLSNVYQTRPAVQSNRKTCVPPSRRHSKALSLTTNETESDEESKSRTKRYVYPFSEDFDAYDVFNKFGTVVITNFKLITKTCYTGPNMNINQQAQFLVNNNLYNTQNEDKLLSVRSFFPETWLWELVPVRESKKIERTLPHTITQWSTNIVCVSPSNGLGFAQPSPITSFQPFFVDIIAPYSLKREEILHLNTILFNYMNYSLPIRITLGNSTGLRLLREQTSASYCVLPGDTANHVFPLIGQHVGETSLKVLAEVDSSYPGQCGPETIVNTRDVVTKTVIIEPEGYPIKTTKTALLCGSEPYSFKNVSWDLTVPYYIVPNTAKAKLSFNADLLGPTIENLEELLTLPTGCGEQIMASMAPNIYVFKYLNDINEVTPAIRSTVIKNLKIGYQRILNYVHKDGSFSPFGYHDPFGSTFLTTFVVKVLTAAKEFIYVDQRVIDRAISWVYIHQLENGCFDAMLHVFQDMGGTSSENSTTALTSYVIISLFEANVDIPETILDNAKYCIRGYTSLDKYTLAISSYALYKIQWYHEANRVLNRLIQISEKDRNMMWWSNKDKNGSVATDIEITSYVLLSLLQNNNKENLANAHSVVRWLTSKRGPHGGFKSTQDTVVALSALSKYASLIGSKNIDLQLEIKAQRQHLFYQVKQEDKLKSKKINLKELNNTIDINVVGEGCLLIQTVLSYYVKNIPQSDSFRIALEVSPLSTTDQCSMATLSPCIAYTGPESHANMAVLEVNLPSGYKADRASLYKLTENKSDSKVKLFEEIKDQVVLYFTRLDKQETCVSFEITQDALVKKRVESLVKLYDYYKPEFESSEFFKMLNECQIGQSPKLPSLHLDDTNTTSYAKETLTEDISTYSLKQQPLTMPKQLNNDTGSNETVSTKGTEAYINGSSNRNHSLAKRFIDKDIDLDTPDCNTYPRSIQLNKTEQKTINRERIKTKLKDEY